MRENKPIKEIKERRGPKTGEKASDIMGRFKRRGSKAAERRENVDSRTQSGRKWEIYRRPESLDGGVVTYEGVRLVR